MAATCGVPPSTFWDRVARGTYRRLPSGGWLAPGAPVTWRACVLGAVAVLGEEAVASHATALRLHGLEDPSGQQGIEVTLPHRRRHKAPTRLVVHRTRDLPPDSVAVVDGIHTTTVARLVPFGTCPAAWTTGNFGTS